jgi:predicted kinase
MRAIVTTGISNSGKTTFTEEFIKNNDNWVDINRDNLRFPDGDRDYYHYKFNKNKEKKITEDCYKAIDIAAKLEKNIIISDTNLNEGRLKSLVELIEAYNYDVEVKRFDISFEEAVKRDNQRYGGVGASVITNQWLQLYGEKYERDEDLPSVYISDLDGTVAKTNGRGHFDWDRVDEDLPIPHMVKIIQSLYDSGSEIIFFSGRDGSCENKTRNWIMMNFNIEYQLFMRHAGDMRKDYIVKEELFNEHIRGIYNVDGVFDDRPQVLRLWLKLGLPLLSVGNPFIEF